MDNVLFESLQYWYSQKLQDETLLLLEIFPDPEKTQFRSVSMSSMQIKTLILDKIYIDRFLLVAFDKYISLLT